MKTDQEMVRWALEESSEPVIKNPYLRSMFAGGQLVQPGPGRQGYQGTKKEIASIENLKKGKEGRNLWNISQKEDMYSKVAKAMKKVEETGDWEYLLTKLRKAEDVVSGPRTFGAKKGMLDHTNQL